MKQKGIKTTNSHYAEKIFSLLKSHYPAAKMILQWSNNFELLVAIILSAQCTDKKVNEVTAKLFPKYKRRNKAFVNYYEKYSRIHLTKNELIELVNFANIPISELEQDIRPTGFYHNKAKHTQGLARIILDVYKGIPPKTIEALTKIPGVGRKTANVFLGNAYGIYEGIAVDTHVKRQSQSLGLTKHTDPDKIEHDLMTLFPQKKWFALTYLLIEHGRNVRRKKSDRVLCNSKTCILCLPYR